MIKLEKTGKQNCTSVKIGAVELFFSYETLIGVSGTGYAMTGKARVENTWGPTTGKHINQFGLKEAPVVSHDRLNEIAEAFLRHTVAL